MRKRRRTKKKHSFHRLVSAAAVGVATVMTMNVLSSGQARWLFTAAEAAVTAPGSEPDRSLWTSVDAKEQLIDELIFEYESAKCAGDEAKIAFARQFAAKLERIEPDDNSDPQKAAFIYKVYSRALAARDSISKADLFERDLESVVAVFTEFDRLKRSGVFCADGVREITSGVSLAVEGMSRFYSSKDAACLEGTLLARARDEFFASAIAAAAFLEERMDVLCEEVSPEQYVVYRYAIGGGWEEHALPEWFSMNVLSWHAHIVRRQAAMDMFNEIDTLTGKNFIN